MIRNYLKAAVRNLLRQKGFSFINIFGLSLGISCAALIGMWVNDEVSYDRFRHDHGRIYRLMATLPEMDVHAAVSRAPITPALKAELPEVEDAVRITNIQKALIQVEILSLKRKMLSLPTLISSEYSLFHSSKMIKNEHFKTPKA